MLGQLLTHQDIVEWMLIVSVAINAIAVIWYLRSRH